MAIRTAADSASPPQIPTLTESSRYDASTQSLQGSAARQIAALYGGRRHGGSLLDRETAHASNGDYEVQPNDNYWTISERLYGAGAYFAPWPSTIATGVPRRTNWPSAT